MRVPFKFPSPLLRSSLTLLAGLTLSACAGKAGMGIKHSFPGADELAALGSKAAPDISRSFESASLSVREWDLVGPFPMTPMDAQASDPGGLGHKLVGKLGRGQSTAAMDCVARELAHFSAAHGGQAIPPVALNRYFAARCFAAPVQLGLWVSDLGEFSAIDDKLEGEIIDRYLEKLSNVSADTQVGAWAGVIDGRAALAIAMGQAQAQVDALNSEWDQHNLVRVTGTLKGNYEWLQASIGHGHLGYGECNATPGTDVVLPRFDVQCSLHPDDDVAIFSLMAGEPGQLLGETRLILTVNRDPESGKHIELLEGLKDGDAATVENLVASINRIRGRLNFGELQLASAQSQTAAKLLPHFVDATMNSDTATTNKVALGMIAGWEIEDPIRGAELVSYTARANNSAPDLVAELLFLPSYREALLDPELRNIALAVHTDESGHAATMLASTYKFFEKADYSAQEAALLDELDRQRAAKGMRPVERVDGDSTNEIISPVMAKLATGAIDPGAGLSQILEGYSTKLQRSFGGFVMTTLKIDGYMPKFSGEVLTRENVLATVRIGHHISEESSWGQFVAYVIYMPN